MTNAKISSPRRMWIIVGLAVGSWGAVALAAVGGVSMTVAAAAVLAWLGGAV